MTAQPRGRYPAGGAQWEGALGERVARAGPSFERAGEVGLTAGSSGTSLAVQWLKLHAADAGGMGSTPGLGTEESTGCDAWPEKGKK